MQITIEALAQVTYPLVNRFYRDQSYPAKAGREDLVWVARDGTTIVAALTLIPQQNHSFWLRGMVVASAYRGQGVGLLLLNAVCSELQDRLLLNKLAAKSIANTVDVEAMQGDDQGKDNRQAIPCYCFPFAELEYFYQQAGFRRIEASHLPSDYLKGAYTRYCEQGRDLIVMVYP